MSALEQHADGVILKVKAQPGSRRNAVSGEHAGALKVSVTQAPEKGKANEAIVQVLCDALTLRKSQIELIAGQTSSQKRFLIREITMTELAARIATAIGSD